MKIERIDDKTVKCFISNEELADYELTYKDFLMRTEKAKVVVEEIIEQAEEEVGYRPPELAFDLQVMVIPEQGMLLTFSEKTPEELGFGQGKELLECLKEVKEILGRRKKQREGALTEKRSAGEKTGGEGLPENREGTQEQTAQPGAEETGTGGADGLAGQSEKPTGENVQRTGKAAPTFAVFSFNRLSEVCDYARALPTGLRIRSSLYRMDEVYYLYLDKGAASYDRYSRCCIQAMEFGSIYAATADRVTYLLEHGECLIADRAVKKLRL